MPIRDEQLDEARRCLLSMLMDTVRSIEAIHDHAQALFGARAGLARAAIDACLDDSLRDTAASGQAHPRLLLDAVPARRLQAAGLYGAQLALKQAQVTAANTGLRLALDGLVPGLLPGPLWWRRLARWDAVIDGFLAALAPAIGLGAALASLKDILRDETREE